MPRLLIRIAGSVIRALPEGLVARLLPRRFRYDPRSVPPPAEAPRTEVALWVGPVNWAGQAWNWARSAERAFDGVGAVVMNYRLPNSIQFPADLVVPAGAYAFSRRWQAENEAAVISRFTHVLIEAERQPFGAVLTQTLDEQVDRLRRAGLTVAMVCHGTDIRLPSRHAASHPYSPFAPGVWSRTPALERAAARNAAALERLGLPVFVSTPDLLRDVPDGIWLPVVVDPALWRSGQPALARSRPVIVHAPSSGIIKGSDLIDPILARMHADGLVEYRRVQGVPSRQMPGVYGDADVVLDQFRIGSYGVAACEAMAAGRVVVANVSEDTRHLIRQATGRELPIVQADPSTLAAVLRGMIDDPTSYREAADRGIGFVDEIHDGRRSAAVLAEFLGQ